MYKCVSSLNDARFDRGHIVPVSRADGQFSNIIHSKKYFGCLRNVRP